MRIQRIRALVIKDLKRFLRDPATLFMSLIFPIILTAAFGAAFGGLGSGSDDLRYVIGFVDFDQSNNQKWADSFKDEIEDTGALVVVEYDDNETALYDLLQGSIDAVIIIPFDFGESIDTYLNHPNNPAFWINTTVDLAVDKGSLLVGAAIPPMVTRVLTSTIFGDNMITMFLPVEIGVPTLVASSSLSQFDYMVPGLFSYAAIFLTMNVALAFATERGTGILRRIDLTATSSSEVIVGSVFSNLVVGGIQVLMVYIISNLMGFKPQSSILGILYALTIVLFLVLCNVGFGLITASLVNNSGAVMGLSFVFILPQMLLGTFVPASPSIARLVPSYYVTDALTSLFLRGASLNSPVIMYDLLIVATVSIVTIAVGILVFNKYGRR